ncbi:MAG: NAD(P)/FAD-dependent oxidoreductase [Polyangiaceae bacterium]|nr:NAD(P)/FAD-dependent oxidoreductase [Polyangiaceae bacterium]
MSDSYDAIFIGSGHNALVAAAMLAKAGWSVLVLEKNDRPGGFVRTDALTLPGFLHDTYSSAHPLFTSGPAYAELAADLGERGLRYVNTDVPTGVSLPGGRTAVYFTDMAASVAEAERLSPGDGAAFADMIGGFAQHAGPIFGLFAQSLATPQATALIRQLMLSPEGPGLSELAVDFLLPARDLLESRFRSDVWRALLAPWLGHAGRAPEDANSGFWVPLFFMAMGAGISLPAGGSEALAVALSRLIRDKGGVIRCEAPVERVLVESGAAAGVVLAGGEQLRARRAVVACTNPDQLYLKLLAGTGAVPAQVERQASRYRYGRGCVQIALALSGPLTWPDERLARGYHAHLTPGLDGLSKSNNEAARGLLPAEPTISLDVPTQLDPSRAPEGKHTARLQMLDVPRHPRGDAAGELAVTAEGWTDDLKERFADRVIDIATRHIPNLKSSILARHVVSSRDLALYNPNAGDGDPYGGVHDLAQSYLLRPLASQPSHRTAVSNLYMCGAATWPGHGVGGSSGYIVARDLLGR